MDREYAVMRLKQRIEELRRDYKIYKSGYDKENDKRFSEGYCKSRRSSVQKELNTCRLVLYLLESSSLTFIDDFDAVKGLQRLVEVQRH